MIIPIFISEECLDNMCDMLDFFFADLTAKDIIRNIIFASLIWFATISCSFIYVEDILTHKYWDEKNCREKLEYLGKKIEKDPETLNILNKELTSNKAIGNALLFIGADEDRLITIVFRNSNSALTKCYITKDREFSSSIIPFAPRERAIAIFDVRQETSYDGSIWYNSIDIVRHDDPTKGEKIKGCLRATDAALVALR